MMYKVCINTDKTFTLVHTVRWGKQVHGLFFFFQNHRSSVKKGARCLLNLRGFMLNFTLLPVLSFTMILKYTITKGKGIKRERFTDFLSSRNEKKR